MRIVFVGVGIFLVLASVINYSQTAPPSSPIEQHSMKGWELYSWKSGGSWFFRLMVGTNRQKTESEIKKGKEHPTDIVGIKKELSSLKKGELVFWQGHAEGVYELPPANIVKDIVAHAQRHGITITLPEQETTKPQKR